MHLPDRTGVVPLSAQTNGRLIVEWERGYNPRPSKVKPHSAKDGVHSEALPEAHG